MKARLPRWLRQTQPPRNDVLRIRYNHFDMYDLRDTITAICTPAGVGSISVIRVAGTDSWEIVSKIFTPSSSAPNPHSPFPSSFSHMQAQHGSIKDGNKLIDEVIVIPYKAPKSFTTEDTVEICTHGGNQVTSMVLDLCLRNGARLAKNGEFTFRAFINGRIDLTEAEAINELINATSSKTVLSANEILSGGLKNKVLSFRERLLNLVSGIESSIEFPMDVGSSKKDEISIDLKKINLELLELIETSKEGQLLRDGVKVSIIGSPNAGKSSLLNQLLESERAIVTSKAGTTRDTIEERVIIDGWPIVLVDTAGLRKEEISDEAEKIGIERSKSALEKSDIALFVFDITKEKDISSNEILHSVNGKPKILIGNKIDLNSQLAARSSQFDVLISAKEGTNIENLKSLIIEKIKFLSRITSHESRSTFYVNQRQKELLLQCSNSIDFAQEIIKKNDPEDLIADELKRAISKLDEVSGQKINDDVIANVFTKFCIGK